MDAHQGQTRVYSAKMVQAWGGDGRVSSRPRAHPQPGEHSQNLKCGGVLDGPRHHRGLTKGGSTARICPCGDGEDTLW